MNSEGSGLGLQIQGGLASQWFESTFCAFFSFSVKERKKKERQKESSRSETRTHNLPVNSRARCRLRHPGPCTRHQPAIQKITALLCRGCCSMRGSNPRLLAHKTNTLPTELMEPTLAQTGPRGALSLRLGSWSRSQASPPERAVLAEWLRRMLKAHVRKSVGSIPTDCTPFLCQPNGGVAHSVERSVRNRQAQGSKPCSSTSFCARKRGERREERKKRKKRQRRDSNSRGQSPVDF